MVDKKKDLIYKIQQLEKLKKELLIRKAREDFWTFITYCEPATTNKPIFENRIEVSKPVADMLQKLADGEYNKVRISMPPRLIKSWIISWFSIFCLGRNPHGSVMRCTVTMDLAREFSKTTKSIIEFNERVREVFPDLKLDKNDKSAESWKIEGNTRTSYFGSGAGGNIIGKGASEVAITDDLFKSFSQAASPRERKKIWNWRIGSFTTRIEDNCPIVDIGTCWNKQDHLALLSEANYYDAELILPAIVDGETICEHWKSTAELMDLKDIMDKFMWEAEYMQNPISEEGLMYTEEFATYDVLPDDTGNIYCMVDPADKGEDFLCAMVYTVAERGNKKYAYILDVMYTQKPMIETETLLPNFLIRNNVVECKIEVNKESNFPRIMSEKMIDAGHQTTKFTPRYETKNKAQRIREYSSYVQTYVLFPSNWKTRYPKFYDDLTLLDRLLSGHDDAADCTSAIARDVVGSLKRVILI